MEWRSEFASYNLGRIDGFLRANDRNLIFQEDLPGWQNARLQGLRIFPDIRKLRPVNPLASAEVFRTSRQ
jgi:hypothetical protein